LKIFYKNNCSKCEKEIGDNEGQYYCHWCKLSFCENCTESLNDQSGLQKLVHPDHNLLYFQTRDPDKLKNLDTYKLGKNLFTTVPEGQLSRKHSASCNGCEGQFSNSDRYICISCRPGLERQGGFSDFDSDCFKILKNPLDPNYEKIKDNDPDHDHKTHVYLRLVFQTHDYYTY